MPTLPLHSLHVPHVTVFPAVARAFSAIGLMFDVFAEADEHLRMAHKRYPFIKG